MSDNPFNGMPPMRCVSISEKVADVGKEGKIWVYTFVMDTKQGALMREREREVAQIAEDRGGALAEDAVSPALAPMDKQWRIASSRKLEVELDGLYVPTFHQVEEIPTPPINIREALGHLFPGAAVVSLADLQEQWGGVHSMHRGRTGDDGPPTAG